MQVNISHNNDHTLVTSPSLPGTTLKLDNNGTMTLEASGVPTRIQYSRPRGEVSLNDFCDIFRWLVLYFSKGYPAAREMVVCHLRKASYGDRPKFQKCPRCPKWHPIGELCGSLGSATEEEINRLFGSEGWDRYQPRVKNST